MLPKSEHVQQVYYAGDNSLLSASESSEQPKGTKLFLECSTIDPVVTREVGSKIQDSGLGDFADAAVSVRSPSRPKSNLSLTKAHRAAPSAPKKAPSPT